MMYRCWHIILVLLLVSLNANARTEADVKSFLTLAPDTILQGEPFVVVYQLTANEWKSGATPRSENGFCLLSVSFDIVRETSSKQLLTKATYSTSQVGVVELPRMTITVGDSVLVSQRKKVVIKPNADHGKEMAFAFDWLTRHGQSVDSICLSVIDANLYFLTFEDAQNHCFCIVARSNQWSTVDHPVFAYSTEAALRLRGDRKKLMVVIEPYIHQMEAMQGKQANKQPSQPYRHKYQRVKPLLGRLEWGQEEPFNKLAPRSNGQRSAVGCVPMSAMMVANYHKWPQRGQSHVYYKLQGEAVSKVDFTQLTPSWDSYQKSYKEADDTPSLNNLAEMLTAIGKSINASYSDEGTGGSLGRVKQILCNNMDYSGRATYFPTLGDHLMESLIWRELDNQRPCILGNGEHAFVCDGYDGDYLHFNMGWYGTFNGYYRIRVANYPEQADDEDLLLIKSIVYGIQPLREDVIGEVTLETPGTLSELLTDEDKESLTKLTVSGPLNSSDISLLRKMAGAVDFPEFDSWQGGSLKYLDLTDATIMADSLPYLVTMSVKTWKYTSVKGNNRQTIVYDFNNMTEQQWKGFNEHIGAVQEGVVFTRKDDNTYWAHYHCQDNVLGERMFMDCSSLQTLILPNTLERIGNYAFSNCSLLQTIRIPGGVRQIGKLPFYACHSLEQIVLPKGIQTDGTIHEKCSPGLQIIR